MVRRNVVVIYGLPNGHSLGCVGVSTLSLCSIGEVSEGVVRMCDVCIYHTPATYHLLTL